jgi:glutathione S-transferase
MIVLHQGPAKWGVANISPFCLKLESYLRMAGLQYTARNADFRRTPKGKIPFIEEDGKILGDSQLIIEHLQRKHGDSLDAKLRPEDRAQGHLVRRMLEESTYWHIVHVRYVPEQAWAVYKPIFEALLPPIVGKFVAPRIRSGLLKSLHAHGLGRHQPAEVLEMGKQDISALATLLGDKPFLLGDHPSSFDATAYAFLASITAFPVDSPFRSFTLEQKNLVQYVDRFHQRYFANWNPPA